MLPSRSSRLPAALGRKRRWVDLGVCLLIATLTFAMQYRSGAWHVDLAYDADEPAHAVSSLMVHDYLIHALGTSPVPYAQAFYAHYPKVAIGHWPPLFYAAEALWMLVFGRSPIALLLFVALCATALLCSLYIELRKRTSLAAALVGLAVLVHPTFSQTMLMTVHPEMLLALSIFWAAIFCGRWMKNAKLRDGLLFVLFSVLALGVNGRAAVLVLLPFGLLRLRTDRTRWLWLVAGLIVLGACIAEPHFLKQTDPFTLRGSGGMGIIYLQQVWRMIDPLTLVLAAAGLVLAWRTHSDQAFWWAMSALVICSFVLFVLLPVRWDDRYLLSMLPAAGAMAALAMDRLLQRISTPLADAAIALAALVVLSYTLWTMEIKPDHGFRRFVAGPIFRRNPVALIDGDGINEGGLIVEACLQDPEIRHTVLRGSKTMAAANWNATDFQLRFASDVQVQTMLRTAHVGLVAVQTDLSRTDDLLLRHTMKQNADQWMSVEDQRLPPGLAFFQVVRP